MSKFLHSKQPSEIGTTISKKNGIYYIFLAFVLISVIIGNPTIDVLTLVPKIQSLASRTNTDQVSQPQIPASNYYDYLPIIYKQNHAFYVSLSGSDSNPGTITLPWRTIQHAADQALPGDTIYIRGGVYHEAVFTSNGGTEGNPIRFRAYPGEAPVIDGEGNLPSWSEALFTLYEEADYVEISGLEIRNSTYNGILAWSDYVSLDNLSIHHTQSTGILVIGNYSTIAHCHVYRTNLNNEYDLLPSNWGAGIEIAGNSITIPQYGVIRNCTVWENWGEGINTHRSNGVIIEDNIVHDSLSANIYISDATNTLVQRNFVYLNPDSYIFGYGSQVGIMMGDELYQPPSANNTIINNVAYGNNRNFYWWQGSEGGGMINLLIANNTFVNSVGTSGVKFIKPIDDPSEGSYFINNIIQQDGELPIILVWGVDDPELHFSNNLWSKTPPSNAAGANDIIGNPQLVYGDNPFVINWFMLTGLSPAIGGALPLPDVTLDYFVHIRDSFPDMGAIEYIPVP